MVKARLVNDGRLKSNGSEYTTSPAGMLTDGTP